MRNYKFGIMNGLIFLFWVPAFGQQVSPSDSLFAWTVQERAETRNLKPETPKGRNSKLETRNSAERAGPLPRISDFGFRISTREFWALAIVDKGLKVWDIELTQRRLSRDPYWKEMNPFLPRRPSRARMYGQFMGLSAGADYLAWRLRRAGHPNWARALQIGSIAVSAYCIGYNATHPARYALPAAATGPSGPLRW